MTNRLNINDRDILIFELLNKFRVLDSELIMKLANFGDLTYTSRRLAQLTEYNYIGRERDGNTTPYIYFLRNKGMSILNDKTGRNERPYIIRKFSKSSLFHELMIAEICYIILQNNSDLRLEDIQTDRDLRKQGYNPDEVGDIRIYKYKINIEVENTQKTFKRYPSKFAMNEDGFGQLWILNGFKTLERKLNDYIAMFVTDRFVQAILLENVPSYDFDLSDKAEFYQKQIQLKFDAEIERQNKVRAEMEADRKRRTMIIEREQKNREEREAMENAKLPFWKRK